MAASKSTMTSLEAAAYLGFSRQRMYKLTEAGLGTFNPRTGRWSFTKAELDRWRIGQKPPRLMTMRQIYKAAIRLPPDQLDQLIADLIDVRTFDMTRRQTFRQPD